MTTSYPTPVENEPNHSDHLPACLLAVAKAHLKTLATNVSTVMDTDVPVRVRELDGQVSNPHTKHVEKHSRGTICGEI